MRTVKQRNARTHSALTWSTVRLGLSLILAVGWWVQRLPAQAPIASLPEAQAPCRNCPAEADPATGSGPPAHKSLLRKALNNHGVGCWTTHNSPGCGSLHSNLTFVFGSCRVFFGEPCLSPPPAGQGLGR